MKIQRTLLALVGAALVIACGPAASTAPAPAGRTGAAPASTAAPALTPERDRLLRNLVARANQEGALNAQIVDIGLPSAGSIRDAFVNRFAPLGLNITVNIGAAQQPAVWASAQAAIASGGSAEYDAMIGQDDSEVLPRYRDGMFQRIDHWQELLAAIDPAVGEGRVKPEARSPEPFAGYAFAFDDRLKVLLYNPETMPRDPLPKTYLDLAEPRYKGQFVVPPWATAYGTGMIYYGRERWADVVTAIGQNAAGVATYAAGTQQILSKQVAFQQDNLGNYFAQKSQAPSAPLDYALFSDFTGWNTQYYVVPIRAKHPAAATLFALFQATDQGRAAWAPSYVALNIRDGRLPLDEQIQRGIVDSKTKLVDWFGTPEARALLDWLSTDEGKSYDERMSKALSRRG